MSNSRKRIIIAGGSGFLGNHLKAHFESDDFEVLILSRSRDDAGFIHWDAQSQSEWTKAIDGSHALINMAGRTVDCRYTKKNRTEILESRLESTRALGKAVQACAAPPKFWLNSSTATIYQDTPGDAPANTEAEGIIGDDFSMNVAKEWEKAFFSFDTPNTIKTALRASIILGSDGGAFPVMAKLARLGMCSPQGDGQQWISWMHIEDFCSAVGFLLEHPLPGAVNLCSPNPVQNQVFNQHLRARMRPLMILPQPTWLLELGAIFLRTQTELILKSRKVIPDRLAKAGFAFKHPDIEAAIAHLTP